MCSQSYAEGAPLFQLHHWQGGKLVQMNAVHLQDEHDPGWLCIAVSAIIHNNNNSSATFSLKKLSQSKL